MGIDSQQVGTDWGTMNKRLIAVYYVDKARAWIKENNDSDYFYYREYTLDEEYGVKETLYKEWQDDLDKADATLAGFQDEAQAWAQGIYDALPENFWLLLRPDSSVAATAATALDDSCVDIMATRIPDDFADLGSTEVWQGEAADGFRTYYSHLFRTRNNHAWLANQLYRGLALTEGIINEAQQSLANVFKTGGDQLGTMLEARAAGNDSSSGVADFILLAATATAIISAIPTLGEGAAASFAIGSALIGYAGGSIPGDDQDVVQVAFDDAQAAGKHLGTMMGDIADRSKARWSHFENSWLAEVKETLAGMKADGNWVIRAPSLVHGTTPRDFHDTSASDSW